MTRKAWYILNLQVPKRYEPFIQKIVEQKTTRVGFQICLPKLKNTNRKIALIVNGFIGVTNGIPVGNKLNCYTSQYFAPRLNVKIGPVVCAHHAPLQDTCAFWLGVQGVPQEEQGREQGFSQGEQGGDWEKGAPP